MDDVGLHVTEDATKLAHREQGAQRLVTDRQRDVLATLRLELGDKTAAGGNHDRAVPGRDQCPGDFQGRTLGATRMKGGDELYDGHRPIWEDGGHGRSER